MPPSASELGVLGILCSSLPLTLVTVEAAVLTYVAYAMKLSSCNFLLIVSNIF
jgi:hypothetical protein